MSPTRITQSLHALLPVFPQFAAFGGVANAKASVVDLSTETVEVAVSAPDLPGGPQLQLMLPHGQGP